MLLFSLLSSTVDSGYAGTSGAALGFRNRMNAGGVTLSGGSWSSALPLTNMLTTDRSEVARSSDAATASTQFRVDFGQTRALRAVALQNHNLSQAATWRITLGTTAGGTEVYNGAGQAAWFLPFAGPEEWEDNNWWGISQDEYTGHPHLALQLLSSTLNARYMDVFITDTANAAGYVQFGRIYAGELWQPAYNMVYGAEYSHEDASTVERTVGGGVVADRQRATRTANITFDLLSDTERSWAYEIQRRARTTEEVLWLPDPTDYQLCQRHGFLGTLKSMSPLALRDVGVNTKGFELQEWI